MQCGFHFFLFALQVLDKMCELMLNKRIDYTILMFGSETISNLKPKQIQSLIYF